MNIEDLDVISGDMGGLIRIKYDSLQGIWRY